MTGDRTDRSDPLLRLRAEMDDLNRRLLLVLQERAQLCRRVAAHKLAAGLPMVDPAREQQMLASLLAQPGDGFPAADLERILGAVFAASRAVVEGVGRR